MRLLFLNVVYATEASDTFLSDNVICKKNVSYHYKQHSIETQFSFNVEWFDDFIKKHNVEILDRLPEDEKKYIILYNLSDMNSVYQEFKKWNKWIDKKDEFFMRIVEGLRNDRCAIIFRNLHDSDDDIDKKSRDYVLNWLDEQKISPKNMSYLGCGVPNEKWWKKISAKRVHTTVLESYSIFKALKPEYYLSSFINNIYYLRQKHYVTYNHHWKSGYRTKLVKFLIDNGYRKKGYISYKPSLASSPSDSLSRIYLDSSESSHKDPRGDTTRHSSKLLEKLIEQIGEPLEQVMNINLSGTRTNSPLHFNSYFNIIVNYISHGNKRKGIDLDEKLFRPVMHLQPFIVMGSYELLKRFKKHGFKTFHPFIDESYDDEENDTIRMEMMLKEVDKLCRMSRDEIDSWYYKIHDRLIYNFEHFSVFCNTQMKIVTDEVERHWSLMHE